ncbi:MAG: hypothetical protein ACYC61_06780 [Isosphaeraceae bacterium]
MLNLAYEHEDVLNRGWIAYPATMPWIWWPEVWRDQTTGRYFGDEQHHGHGHACRETTADVVGEWWTQNRPDRPLPPEIRADVRRLLRAEAAEDGRPDQPGTTAGGPGETPAPVEPRRAAPAKRRPGRKHKLSDDERRAVDAWNSGQYRSFDDVKQALGTHLTISDIRKAVNRVNRRAMRTNEE